MPGVMDEHHAVATVGSIASTMFPFRYVDIAKPVQWSDLAFGGM